jgi:hypothetical protein
MLKKTITFTDFNDVEQTKDFYFNLTQAELVEMQMSEKEGLAESLQQVIDAKELTQVIPFFKMFISKAYGEKDDNGLRFVKSSAISEGFLQTEAYSVLFMQLVSASDELAGAAFIEALMPAALVAAAKATAAKAQTENQTVVVPAEPQRLVPQDHLPKQIPTVVVDSPVVLPLPTTYPVAPVVPSPPVIENNPAPSTGFSALY